MKSVVAIFPKGSKFDPTSQWSRGYEYFVRPGDEPKEGDFLVTSVANPDEGALLRVARVSHVCDEASVVATKFYLQLITKAGLEVRMAASEELLAIERERVAKEKARKAALAKLRMLAEARALAKSMENDPDPEVQALLKQING